MPKCGTCHWYERYTAICTNQSSEYYAHFTEMESCCTYWKIKKAIAIDFDGCICTNAYPKIGKPIFQTLKRAKSEKLDGAGLILWTCREGKALEEAVDACRNWGLEFNSINESLPEWLEEYKNNPRKVGASEYWDDRAVKMGFVE